MKVIYTQLQRYVLPTLLVAIMVLVTASSLAQAADYVSVAKDGVNLRSGPGTQNEAIFQLPAGYPLLVLER